MNTHDRTRTLRRATFAVCLFAVASALATGASAQWANTARTELSRPGSPTIGPATARVHIVEFFDPACEACAAFHPTVKSILAEHGPKVRLSIRYAPFHRGSEYVIRAMEAAWMQDRFPQALDVVIAEQRSWASHNRPTPELVWTYLKSVGVDVDRARKDADDARITALIAQDKADIRTLDVRQTPTFFVNGKPLKDFGFEQLRALVRAEVERMYGK